MIKLLNITDRYTAEQVLQLQIRAYQVEAQIIGMEDIPPLKDTIESLQSTTETFFGYYHEEILVGVISFQIIEKVLDIHRVFVHPAYFRRGIGRTMIQFLFHKYENQVSGFKVQTGSVNAPAINLYLSLGFQKVDQLMIKSMLSLTVLYRNSSEITRF
ncbi:GNAT family N-acetyltransferase [Shimazuella sp. AN120528]|uniref:GNAT family N-acetyltransferase n=1 Tax=Shimazuella soli TaxID=1892854 RepID=UPI001F0EE035|nr:GNAT family N-acetyltransferase [Shimazuella soli]MCH5585184.1 GNAT family N-acetyltransferase [Shimazuella soli]